MASGMEIKAIEEYEKSNKGNRRISREIQDRVWRRDEGKCVVCGSNEKLEFDHIIPFSKGGANTYRNVQLLCEKCNREKSNRIG
ncbi:HNH endonuclease signature motif containing protein [Algoriphagus halophilus]|uniref:HNH endonuclease n=1 Tax=Algoriphagus halophilus TaxID=226505 RepID=UPI00358E25BF